MKRLKRSDQLIDIFFEVKYWGTIMYEIMICEWLIRLNKRVLCNGKTLAFQARDAGSIPATRSKTFAIIK